MTSNLLSMTDKVKYRFFRPPARVIFQFSFPVKQHFNLHRQATSVVIYLHLINGMWTPSVPNSRYGGRREDKDPGRGNHLKSTPMQ